jgi:hypothetical protein
MRRFRGKKWAAGGVVAALVVGGGVAFALATGTGSGSGSGAGAAGGPAACSVQLQANWDPPGTITPGGTASIDFAAKNTSNQPCLVKSISAAVNSGIGPVSSSNAACQGVIDEQQNQFWLTPDPSGATSNVTVPQNGATGVVIPPGGSTAPWTPLPNNGLLHWLNSSNFLQDACASAPLTLSIVTP